MEHFLHHLQTFSRSFLWSSDFGVWHKASLIQHWPSVGSLQALNLKAFSRGGVLTGIETLQG